MTPEQRRIGRLRRLERLRAIAKRAAAAEAAEAEAALAQLELLAQRTGALAANYAGRIEARDGGELRQLLGFTRGLAGISQTTLNDAAHARAAADARHAALAQAERRRAATQERADERARHLARSALARIGTGLE